MKIEELKHNHSLTDLLKILLFAILMLAPVGMVASRCLYVIVNKNAYQSYYGETINEKQYTQEKPNDLHINDYCRYYQNPTIPTNSGWQDYFISGEDYEITSAPTSTIDASNIKYFGFYAGTTRQSLLFYSSDFTLVYEYYFDNSIALTFNFNYIENYKRYNFGNNDILNDDNFIYKITFNKDSYLDNVFEYSVSQLEESNLFNWTQNTAIYSGINAMNVQLGINSPAITIVLTYWLILTCIYVIIDIVLKLFTYITHMIGSKKA